MKVSYDFVICFMSKIVIIV